MDSKLSEEDARGYKVGLVVTGKRIAETSDCDFLGMGKKTVKESHDISSIQSLLRIELS